MSPELLLYSIVLPALGGLLALVVGNRVRGLREAVALLALGANLAIALKMFGREAAFSMPWAGAGMEFALRLYHFSGFVTVAAAAFGVVVGLYCLPFLFRHAHANQFYGYMLLTLAMGNGVALADNLILLLFFWEGLMLPLFGMIAIARPGAWRTAVKALVIVGATDLCLMLGIALAGNLAGTFSMSKINLPVTGVGGLAFVLMMIGAISKAGSMPFHTWIPDAAEDAPLPFMALVPAAQEKLLGIYFLARISLDLFQMSPGAWVSPLMMIVGAVTILGAVMMALIQKNYKRLLAYHAISQVGYMILGIGTAVPVGIVGGLFHMINHAMYKSCLFLTGGSVERQSGTADLSKLGGLARNMPITFICFLVAAASISGVPPFNGFFSKELVYDGALERGWIYYAAALLGSVLTAASFLKLGHAAYLGPRSEENRKVREAPWAMLLPMLIIAGLCVLFGLWNSLPLKNLIQPILGERLEGHNFSGWPHSVLLVVMTCVALGLALLNHFYGVKRTGKGIGASDHIHHAPGLAPVYNMAERGLFDPYEIGMKIARLFAAVAWGVDRFINWLSDGLAAGVTMFVGQWIANRHSGNFSTYLIWSLIGLGLMAAYVFAKL